MRSKTAVAAIIICVFAIGCEQSPGGSSSGASNKDVMTASENDTMVVEKYMGVLPCIDCEGIETIVELSHLQSQVGGSFTMKQIYTGKKSGDTTIAFAGNWATLKENTDNPGSTIIELNLDKNGNKEYFKRKGKDILMLDKSQQEIPTLLNYTLNRMN
jgi:copper homeostasis protein (lipoprotein)